MSLAALLVAVMLTGCETTITALHDPLYRAANHTSTITATARNSSVGIRRIIMTVTTGEMTDCTELGGPPSIVPCRRNASTVVHTCLYGGAPATASCSFSQAITNRAMVTYSAVAEPVSGSNASVGQITYAGGFPPTAGIARPVWWHRDQPMAGKIDLGFFPDADYTGDYNMFTGHMQPIAVNAIITGGQPFASTYNLFRGNFNLWAGPFGADANGCSRTFNALAASVAAATDGEAIVHSANFRDCAAIALGGSGSVWGGQTGSPVILVHESGHFLHGQGDEYCCDGGYGTAGACRNVFSTEAACQAAAPGAGISTAQCVKIASATVDTGAWRGDNGLTEIMASGSALANWQDNSAQCVVQRFLNCGGGACY